jgi:hypothetical protein
MFCKGIGNSATRAAMRRCQVSRALAPYHLSAVWLPLSMLFAGRNNAAHCYKAFLQRRFGVSLA